MLKIGYYYYYSVGIHAHELDEFLKEEFSREVV